MSAQTQATARHAMDEDDYFKGVSAGMPEGSRRVIDGLEKVKSVYVACDRDDALLTGFNRYLERYVATRRLPRQEADCFFLVGASGAGKTAAIGRLLRDHEALRPVRTPYGLAPRYVSIKLKGYAPPRLVGLQIIREAGYGLAMKTGRGEVWDGMAGHLQSQGVFLVHIDEAQHLLKRNASQSDREELSNAIKGVAIDTKWPIAFVFSGLPEVLGLPIGDDQVERRGNFIRFADVAMPEERDLVIDILSQMGDPVGIASDHLAATDLPERLAFAARHRYARICQLVEGALQEALHWKKARLTTGHFAVAFERRSLAYGQDDMNPFLAEHWRGLRQGSFLTIDDAPARSS
ncbi:ATP-binding protein [Methylobacterium sp. E-025]|uniref:ATP-binding protein n=1 Tax=Methylobacterium sp. E-025 TaxID=2836561 RepID=UPI001FB94733|nr:ATP-binding protein [Methylobacterium sp. E-025]MCJ2109814.1 ATP-binding protein [Methylobacterium sp. E-025]